MLRLSTSAITKFLRAIHSKINEHSGLLEELMARTEDTEVKLGDKTNFKDIEELVKIVGKYEPFDERDFASNLDIKLTSRNSARDQGLDRVMIEEVRTIAWALIDKKLSQFPNNNVLGGLGLTLQPSSIQLKDSNHPQRPLNQTVN